MRLPLHDKLEIYNLLRKSFLNSFPDVTRVDAPVAQPGRAMDGPPFPVDPCRPVLRKP
mgnify:CR=1 FL=1